MSQANVELLSGLVPPGVDQVQLFRRDEQWAQWVEAKGRVFHPHFQSSITLLGGEHTRSGGVNTQGLLPGLAGSVGHLSDRVRGPGRLR